VRLTAMPSVLARGRPPLDVSALLVVLEATAPDLWADALSGEDTVERAARQAAAADIADDLLTAPASRAAAAWVGLEAA
jgi:hypothetical protein